MNNMNNVNFLNHLNEEFKGSNINEHSILQRIVYKSEDKPLFIISFFDPRLSHIENAKQNWDMIQYLRRIFKNEIDIYRINGIWKNGNDFGIEDGIEHNTLTNWLLFLPENMTEVEFEQIIRDIIFKYRQLSYLVKDPQKTLFIQTREGKLIKNIGPLTLANLKIGIEENLKTNLNSKKIPKNNNTVDYIYLSIPFKISQEALH